MDQVGSDSTARKQVISAILDQTVDLALIARLCLGRHWRSADEAQRTGYVALFKEIVLATLARRMGYYTGAERFVVTATRPAGDDTMVASEVVYASKDPPLRLEWRVRTNAANATIIDVLPEGVSMVLTYRSEFDSVVNQRGLSGLLAELKNRATAAAAS
ncbi:MAG: ABC transporter substrate-binding protein [Geminicoccaceae bacterium]